jgi:eukaryotic-like serine/threonine-protein kinase
MNRLHRFWCLMNRLNRLWRLMHRFWRRRHDVNLLHAIRSDGAGRTCYDFSKSRAWRCALSTTFGFSRPGARPLHFDDTSSTPTAFGPYRVLHQIGSGVLGPVFRAFDRDADRLLAIKVFRLDLLPQNVAELAASLRRLAARPPIDTALVMPLDAGLEGTSAFIASPLAPGESIDVKLRHAAPMAVGDVARLLAPVARGLDAAAQQGLVHGALHPRDILVNAETFDACLTGVGIVSAIEPLLERPVLRRPYAAPERLAGEPWDAAADVYSLAVIAHELLTGRRPARAGEQDGEFAAEVTAEQRVELRHVLARALAERPSERFQTASGFIAAITRFSGEAAPRSASRRAADVAPPPAPPPVPAPVARRVESAAAPRPAAAPTPIVHVGPVTPVTPVAPPASPEAHAPLPPVVAPWRAAERPAPMPSPVIPARRRSRLPMGLAIVAAGLLIGVGLATLIGPRWVWPTSNVAAVTVRSADTEVPVTPAPGLAPTGEATRGATTGRATRVEPAQAARRVFATTGRVTVRSTPAGALVTVDGNLYGETPITVRDLAFGAHLVQIARPGHAPRAERIVLTGDAPARTVNVVLQKGLDIGGPMLGTLDVDSQPRGARVRVNGRYLGVTPLRWPEAILGTLTVDLELAGYHSASVPVVVKPGEPARLVVTLRENK